MSLTTPPIHPATRLGHVHLNVANLDQQLNFYQQILGFQLHWRNAGKAALGAGAEDLLQFTELPQAQQVRGTTGLYHTAILVPSRWELAHLLRRIAETETPIQGMVNHLTHLAIYLADAEGNGLELAWDFPTEQWPPFDQMLNLAHPPLNVNELLQEIIQNRAPWTGLNKATKVGHVHLHVNDLQKAKSFYHDLLGFDLIFNSRQFGALFVSAGGYHHHLGLNVWHGIGAPPPPANALGLRYYTVVLPNQAELQRLMERLREANLTVELETNGVWVQDPAQNRLWLMVAPQN